MNEALDYILKKWDLNERQPKPIFIPDTKRRHLALLFAELEFLEGAEIGVNRGSNALKLNRCNPECKLYCIDPWEIYDGLNDFLSQAERHEAYSIAKQLLGPTENIIMIRESSMDALRHFKDGTLDFVYIDGNHEWPYVTHDIFYWAKKVKPGGIVSGHDYIKDHRDYEYSQVSDVVDAYTKAFKIKPWFIMDKAIYPRHPGSWFWVKE